MHSFHKQWPAIRHLQGSDELAAEDNKPPEKIFPALRRPIRVGPSEALPEQLLPQLLAARNIPVGMCYAVNL